MVERIGSAWHFAKVLIESIRPTSILFWLLLLNSHSYKHSNECIGLSNTLVLFCMCWTANILNDIFDEEIDRTSNKGRLLSYYPWMRRPVCLVCLMVHGFYITTFDAHPLVLRLLFVSMHWLYGPHGVTKVPILKNIFVAFNYAAGVQLTLPVTAPLTSETAYVFFFSWFYEIVKDLQDCDNDRRHGLTTTPIVFGQRWAMVFGLLVTLLSATIQLQFGNWIRAAYIIYVQFQYPMSLNKILLRWQLFFVWFGGVLVGIVPLKVWTLACVWIVENRWVVLALFAGLVVVRVERAMLPAANRLWSTVLSHGSFKDRCVLFWISQYCFVVRLFCRVEDALWERYELGDNTLCVVSTGRSGSTNLHRSLHRTMPGTVGIQMMDALCPSILLRPFLKLPLKYLSSFIGGDWKAHTISIRSYEEFDTMLGVRYKHLYPMLLLSSNVVDELWEIGCLWEYDRDDVEWVVRRLEHRLPRKNAPVILLMNIGTKSFGLFRERMKHVRFVRLIRDQEPYMASYLNLLDEYGILPTDPTRVLEKLLYGLGRDLRRISTEGTVRFESFVDSRETHIRSLLERMGWCPDGVKLAERERHKKKACYETIVHEWIQSKGVDVTEGPPPT